jgi:hypothetical protein
MTWSSPGKSAALDEVATTKPSPAVAPAPEVRTLTYSLTLRQNPKRFPDGKPIPLLGDPVFSAGDLIRLAFRSQQGGHLYLFNEGPRPAGRPRNVNILFPSPTSNGGSAEIAGGRAVTIPGIGPGLEFDREQGVEKLWIIWSRARQPGLDAMGKRWANDEHGGEIKAAADIDALDKFLRDYGSTAPEVVVDEETRETTLSAPADVFYKLVRLEHH